MRRWTVYALAMFVGFGLLADAAEAKKPKPAPAETTEAGEAAPAEDELVIKTTGIADIDALFEKANAPIASIKTARTAIDSLGTNLTTALGLPAGTPFKDALADLKTKAEGKITVAMNEQGMPELKPSDAVPANVQAGIDAVNGGITDVQTAAAALVEIPNQMKELIAQAQSFNPKSLMSAGVKPTEAPKIMKTIMGNINVLTKAPEEVKLLGDAVTGLKADIQAAFGG